MMSRKYTLLLLIVCMGVQGIAQDSTVSSKPKKSCSCAFSSINQVGVTAGENDPDFLVQSINGLRYRTWFAGAGIGLDAYKRLSMPLFLDIRKYLWDKAASPFIYADGGYHFIVNRKVEKFSLIDEYTGGLFYDLGVGYKFTMNRKQNFLLSAGYSVKNMEQKQYYDLALIDLFCPGGPCKDYINKYSYRLNRFSFKIGFQF
jgi:hypothetical protein